MELEQGAVKFWIYVAQWIFNVIVAIYLFFDRRQKKDLKEFKAACTQIALNEKEILKIRGDLRVLPSQTQFVELSKEIRSLTKELSETKGRLNGINRAVDLINEFLIQQGANKR